MRAKTYTILTRAIEEGFRRGYRRAFKYADNPSENTIEENVLNAIMGDICEVFDFDDELETPRCRKCSGTEETP